MSERIEIDLNKKLSNINKSKKVHFMGIGGIGVSGISKCFLGLGYKVSGSDIKENKNTDLLKEMGAEIFVGHDADNLRDVGVIVASSAIRQDNPEIIEAKKQGIDVYHRSHALEYLLAQSICSVGFSGTHGKTTTTGMASLIFELANKKPTSIIGGILPQIQTNAKLGNGDFAVAELDESDGTILLYQPSITVLTNLEVDHIDHYKDGFAQLLDTFKTFVGNLPKTSKLVLNADDDGVLELYKNIDFDNVIFYSSQNSHRAQFKAKNIVQEGLSSSFDVYKNENLLGGVKLNVPGEHNVSNALGVIVSCLEAGLSFDEIQKTIPEFVGTGRRFEFIGEYNGARVYDDYAHHPTEILATLNSAKQLNKDIVAVFQPHRYSRLKGLWEDFKNSFDGAEKVIVTDVFPAGETHLDDYNAEVFANEIGATYLSGSIDEVRNVIGEYISQDDVVLTIGAGDITRLGRELCKK